MPPALPISLAPHVVVQPSSDLVNLLASSSLPPLHELLECFSPLSQGAYIAVGSSSATNWLWCSSQYQHAQSDSRKYLIQTLTFGFQTCRALKTLAGRTRSAERDVPLTGLAREWLVRRRAGLPNQTLTIQNHGGMRSNPA